MPIQFASQNILFVLNNKKAIKEWIKKVVVAEKKQVGQINYVFLSDSDLLKLNIEFLNHKTYTDIITFDYNAGEKVNADIFISVDRVRENASKFQTTFMDELHRVMVHGILHLCGYKDKTKKHRTEMRQREEYWLKKR